MTAYVTCLVVTVILLFPVIQSSTVGVEYVSSLIKVQDREKAPASVQLSAARAVLHRFIPSHSSSFDFQIITKEQCGGVSCFMISNHPSSNLPGAPEILISGVTGVELLSGLHWYLKNLCAAHISWDKTGGSQLSSVPKAGFLPRMKDDILLIQRPVPWNYYQNAVTSSYTFAWWDWQRWEKEIDWMAIQGINMPLAFTGQEAIWQKVFEKFNISNADLNDFFGGPAFLAWSRMANLHGWGGPLPQSWLDQQFAMQKKIFSRMYELGMTPVLPAFSGNVPAALKNVYPSAKITRLGNWCMLHNFAGNVEMYGVLDSVGSGPVEARISKSSTMVGVGMSMEGIEQNPVVYDLMSEMAFQHSKIDVKTWVDSYPTRRYGRFVPSLQEAWNILYHTVYNCTDGAYDKNRDVIVAFPDIDPSFLSKPQMHGRRYLKSKNSLLKRFSLKDDDEAFDKPHLWYSTPEVIRALELFIEGGNEVSGSKTYRYDLVDLTRQALAKYANDLFLDIISAYDSHDGYGVTHLSEKFLDLVNDMDTLLACHEGFLLGPWLESSKQLAVDKEQEIQYEWNARTQITMWFDNTEVEASLLRDYGNKYWSGLLRDYYGPRAAIYFKYLMVSLAKGESFNVTGWRREWIKLTNDWQNARYAYPIKSEGDALSTSQWLFNKYLLGSAIIDH